MSKDNLRFETKQLHVGQEITGSYRSKSSAYLPDSSLCI